MTMNCTFLLLATAKAALLRLPFVTYVFTAPATGARAFAYIQYIYAELVMVGQRMAVEMSQYCGVPNVPSSHLVEFFLENGPGVLRRRAVATIDQITERLGYREHRPHESPEGYWTVHEVDPAEDSPHLVVESYRVQTPAGQTEQPPDVVESSLVVQSASASRRPHDGAGRRLQALLGGSLRVCGRACRPRS